MNKLHTRGQEVRDFIISNISGHKKDIVAITGERFSISRPAVLKHIKTLVATNLITVSGTTRDKVYALVPLFSFIKTYPITPSLEEDVVWRDDIAPLLRERLPQNVLSLWQHCFTEMINNAVDHSGGTEVSVAIEGDAFNTKVTIWDNGTEGIFRKIQRELSLHDERHAILELAKGKLTTDPSRHSGEGIFFSSRMVDRFIIVSGLIYFTHQHDDDGDWILENEKSSPGTCVIMKLRNNSPRIAKDIFDQYAPEENDFGFTKTVVPVRLAQYGDELLVSRSQARRLLARVDRFKTVLLDFTGVSAIGQAFADEVFRVFSTINSSAVTLVPINMSKPVEDMIKHVKSSAT